MITTISLKGIMQMHLITNEKVISRKIQPNFSPISIIATPLLLDNDGYLDCSVDEMERKLQIKLLFLKSDVCLYV